VSYCTVAAEHPLHAEYHDHDYGFPLPDDDALFERLVLEINQAGLSWITILRKRDAFRRAYAGFEVDRVAAFTDADRARLMNDPGVIRNRLKVEAAIHNARVIQGLRAEHGGFGKWLDLHHPRSKDEWVKLFRKAFRFTGGEIVNEFLLSTGYLAGAHDQDCPAYPRVLAARPRWTDGR
jgi:DNA-3-methyladenine glycosylase I